MIKGALFDIDDTLYSHKEDAVPTLTYKALEKLKAKGIKIGVCTSRIAAEMENVPKELLDKVDCKIMSTGAVTLIEDKYYKAYSLKYENVIRYIEYFKKHNISYCYSDINGDMYFWGDPKYTYDREGLTTKSGKIMFKEYEDEEISDLFFYDVSDEQLQDIKNIKPDQYMSLWGNSGNIGPDLVDKSFGLLKFCEQYHFTTDEIIAFGDGINDDTMLRMAGIGVAVKNAKANTLLAADYICKKTIEDGGIYDALVDLKIIEEDEYKPKMFFFDNDSTLFNHQINGISDLDFKGLELLKKNGYKLCLNTSRSYDEMFNIPKKLYEVMDYVSLLAGAYILTKDKPIITYIDDEIKDMLIKYFDENDICYRYATDDGLGYLSRHDEKEQLFYDLYRMIPPIKKYEGERVIHFIYYCDEQHSKVIQEIAKDLSVSLMSLGGEIAPANTNKGIVVERICKKEGLDISQSCSFGDALNDYEAIQNSGLGICMGNGRFEVKQIADYITDTVYENGIYQALKYFKFI